MVKKIFILVITVLVLVIVGAFVLNFFVPNTTVAVVDTIEDGIHSTAGISWDLNGNGNDGKTKGVGTPKSASGDASHQGAGVEGKDGFQ